MERGQGFLLFSITQVIDSVNASRLPQDNSTVNKGGRAGGNDPINRHLGLFIIESNRGGITWKDDAIITIPLTHAYACWAHNDKQKYTSSL